MITLVAILFLCVGFMIAVLYIDLVFDVSVLPYRRSQTQVPAAVLNSVSNYYGRITKNPYMLMFVMLTAAGCLVVEVNYHLVPLPVGVGSLLLMLIISLVATIKVIPIAKHLALAVDTDGTQTKMVLRLLPYHLMLMASVLTLAIVQLVAVAA